MPKTAKSDLTKLTAKLFDLPDTAQEFPLQFSMVNYAPLYVPLLNVLAPSIICEIGCEQGGNSSLLTKYCVDRKIDLYLVDPIPSVPKELVASNFVRHFPVKSIEFLAAFKGADVYFVDGDHNYQTVFKELNLIQSLIKSDQHICIFIHDIGWPCAYRDMYYAPDDLGVSPDNYAYGKGVDMCSEELIPFGLNTDTQAAFAIREGGTKNGVRKALEDFIDGSSLPWGFFDLPLIHGLGILYLPERLDAGQLSAFNEIKTSCEKFRPFFSTVEWGRLLLSEQVYEQKHYFEEKIFREQAINEENLKTLASARGKLESTKTELETSQEEIRTARLELEKLHITMQSAYKQREQLISDISITRRAHEKTLVDLEEMRCKAADFEQRLMAVLHSLSWRFTALPRSIIKLAGKILRLP